MTFDNPSGNFENYTSLSITDVVDPDTAYSIDWTTNESNLPPRFRSFQNKYVKIKAENGAVSIDYISWHWLEDELLGGYYDENSFELWGYNNSLWTRLNDTPDTSTNTLSLADLNPSSDYGILEYNYSCMLINSSGDYYIKRNISGAPIDVTNIPGLSKACIVIASSDVSFDCRGYSIINNGTVDSAGIVINGSVSVPYSNITISNCSIFEYSYGAYVSHSNSVHLSNNTVIKNINGLFLDATNQSNLFENIAYDNNIGVYLISSSNNRLTGDRAYNNSNSGFFFLNSENLTITNSTSYNNNIGFQLSSTSGTQMFDIVAHSNTQGVLFGEGTLNITNAHLYDNSNYDMYAASGVAGFNIYLLNITFDNPFGNFENYTSLNIVDSSPGSEVYAIKWNPEPASPPTGYPSFRQKYVNITVSGGSPSIDSIRFTWLDSELGGYEESRFELWFYNGTDWNYTSGQTLNTADNYIEVLNFQPSSVYGILQKNVSECMIISSPGTYSLVSNVAGAPINIPVYNSIYACIVIASNDVDFSCNGFNITNTGVSDATGILINGSDSVNYINVTIRDCPAISAYKFGVYLHKTAYDTVQNVSSFNNSLYGFFLWGSTFNNLTNNNGYNNTNNGFYLSSSNNNTIRSNKAWNNSYYGIALGGVAQYNTIIDNEAFENAQHGFVFASDARYNIITNNSAHDNNENGFDFITSTAADNYIINNTAYSNNNGFYTETSNTFVNNTAYSNNNDGYYLLGSNNCTFINNKAYNNTAGFFIEYSNYTNFINNTAYSHPLNWDVMFSNSNNNNITGNNVSNSDFGIQLDNSNNNVLSFNIAYNNSDAFKISGGST
ncbi:MAG: NosD domain-containing protein, partial [Candidatus Bilamarchaeaceae archaeon]